jgi:aryl-alcohol dehydrogenase-like predicted oxidoreductase
MTAAREAAPRVEKERVGLAAHPAQVTAPIIGPRTLAHLDSALNSLSVHLDEKALARLDDIFPGHQTAPEDYAW